MSMSESYPPAFRRIIDDGDTAEVKAVVIQEKDIVVPVMNLECLDKETLKEACKDWGIFRVENHGVPTALTSGLEEIAKSLLSLPFEKKRKLFDAVKSPLTYFWGTPALNRRGNALKKIESEGLKVNIVEGFNVPLSSLSQIPFSSSSSDDDSQQSKLETFRVLLEEYGRHISRIGVTIFEAIAQTLNLELSGDRRSDYLSESTGNLRVYRYPVAGGGGLGMEVHTDSSVLSILKEDEVGGLQIMKGEEWFLVKPVANTFLVNLGDMMQVISDDEYKSVKHRVGKMKKEKERYSIGYFVFPNKESVIKSTKYKPFTYSHFEAQVQEDVKSFGTKIGLSRFHL